MADSIDKGNKTKNVSTILDRGAREQQSSQREKRLAQHQHWMRVMMEGQATPDLKYQKPKV